MNKYKAKFTGRNAGADGIFYPIETTVAGTDAEDARLRLYDRFEHITRLTLAPMTERHAVKVTFADGNTLTTDINGTPDEVRAYYVGQWFNLGDGNGGDRMAKAVGVEFIG
jgi:hypothetical protein